MPIYEYEPDDRICYMCDGRVAVIQEISEGALKHCPWCGLDVVRVISQTTFKIKVGTSPEKAAAKGLTTFRRVEAGKWEKVAGPGVDMIVGSEEEMREVQAEKNQSRGKGPLEI